VTAPARRAEDVAVDARQAQTARAFGPLLAEQPIVRRLPLRPVAPHVHAYAMERAEEAIEAALRHEHIDGARRWARAIAQGLSTLPLDVDPREAVQAALYRADQRCAIRAGQRVAPVLRAYAGALEEHARVLRADVMCRGRVDEAEARRSEAYAAGLRERSGL